MDSIAEILLKIVGNSGKQSLIAKVNCVGDYNCEVTVVESGLILPNVRLTSGTDATKGIIICPAKDSYVIVDKLNDIDYYVSMYSEIASYKVCVGDMSILITADAITLNDGRLGSNIPDIGKLVGQLNALENKVNNLISTLNGITIPLAPSGTFPFSTIFGAVSSLETTKANDIADEKIKN